MPGTLLISVPDAPLDSKPMAGNMMRNLLDVAIPQKDTTGRPMEGVTSPTASRRPVTLLHLDSQPSGYKSMPDWPRDRYQMIYHRDWRQCHT